MNIRIATQLAIVVTVVGTSQASAAQKIDIDAAKALARQENCTKCHAVDKKKEATSFKEVATKYKGKKDAETTLIKHITSGPKVKLDDGTEEEHKIIKTKDDVQLKNLVGWILSQ